MSCNFPSDPSCASRPSRHRWFLVCAVVAPACAALVGCVTYAAPIPPATLGGPQIPMAGASEVGLGVASGATLFPDAHAGGHGWMGRLRHGLSDGMALSLDLIGVTRQSKMAFGGKGALRLRLTDGFAVEAGFGAMDDSDGKSLGADIAAVVGTHDADAAWNLYAAIRLSGALSVTENLDPDTASELSPNALLAFGTAGAVARLSPWARLVFEGGAAGIFVRGYDDVGLGLYLGTGLLFDVSPGG